MSRARFTAVFAPPDGSSRGVTEARTAAAPTSSGQAAAPDRARRRRRRAVLVLLLPLLAAIGGLYAWHWWTAGRFLEETDDAYLQADVVTIAPKVAGYVAAVLVGDNQPVRAGEVLLRLDDRDNRAALDRAQANVAAAQAAVRNLDAQLGLQHSTIEAAAADVATADAALRFAQEDWSRYQALLRSGAGTVQRAQSADSDLRGRQAALARSRAALAAATQQVDVLRTTREQAVAQLDQSRAAEELAALDLSHTVLAAPVEGAVGDRSVRVGQYVQPGTRLLSVVPMGRALYLVANFKETQLARMRPGQGVAVTVDAFPGHALKGTVDSFSPGTGAEFALLPPENATGNFTKIVQRVPVRVRLDPEDSLLAHLRPGLSVSARVDTRAEPAADNPAVVGEARR